MVTLLITLVFAADSYVGSGFSRTSPPQEKMTTFQLVLLKKGTAPFDAQAKPALTAHGAYMRKLAADRIVAAAGGFANGTDVIGIIIMRVPTVDRAKEINAEDPAIKAGLFTTEILSFMAEDRFMPWEASGSEPLYFGFLNSGANRSQDKETAAQLQKEHLAYMTERDKEKVLLVAGPFIDGGTRRGIVIYRLSSLAEARQVAEGDPMVKAGRLAVELYTWRSPKGALK
jgi:uncharacterized protein YciI